MQKDGFQIEENKSQGFIKLYRSFINWEWYDDVNVKCLFLHCLLKANHESVKWRGQIIERGSFISSYGIIARELNLSVQRIRTSFLKLISTNEITYKSTNLYSIITVNNYEIYQSNNNQVNNQITINQQSNNNQITTNKNEKNIKNEKNNNFIAKSFFQKLIAENEEIKKYIDYSESFIKFLQYKTDIKKQYKTEDSVKNAFLKFVRLANGDVNYGVALVENAIARGWQSIYDLPKEDKIAFQKDKKQNDKWWNDENYGSF